MSTESPFKSVRLPALPLFVAPETAMCGSARAAAHGEIEEAWVSRDGCQLMIRPVCPADIARSRSFLRGLSYGARYFRFGRGDFQFAEADLQGLCNPDLHECMEFIVLAQVCGESVEIAAARYCIEPDGMSCEFAVVVTDAWQGSGVGRRLMEALIRHASARGLQTMYGQILATNSRMLEFAKGLGFRIEASAQDAPLRLVRKSLPAVLREA